MEEGSSSENDYRKAAVRRKGKEGSTRRKREQHLVCTEGPVLVQQVHQGEWHGEAAEQDPRHGHVHDEDVSGGPHHLRAAQR